MPLHVFALGFKKTLPFVSGVIPFGILYATIAVAADYPSWLIILFSILVFGGSSQLVFIDLYQYVPSAFQAMLGSNIVNARHLIYSAGVSNKFSTFPRKWQWILCYLLTDQLYAFSEDYKNQSLNFDPRYEPWYFFGSGFCTWLFWILASIFGIAFGHIIPESFNLGFSIPLMFMPLVFLVSRNKFAYVVCVLAIILTALFKNFPLGLGVFSSILLSSFLGYLIQKYFEKQNKKDAGHEN